MTAEKESTKQKILQSALDLFTQHGYAGTSMGKIAKLAGVNHSLLFHHFGSKAQLWLAVKQHIVESAKKSIQTVPSIDLPFSEFLHQLFVNNVAFFRNHPEIRQMCHWQRVENAEDFPIQVGDTKEAHDWEEAFRHYQQKGDINNKLKLDFILTFVISLISTMSLDPIRYIADEKSQAEYIHFCVERLQKAFD